MAKKAGRVSNLCIKYPAKVKVLRKNKPVMKTVWTEYVRD